MSLKIQFVSDTHMEMSRKIPCIEKHADYLALCGDIGDPFDHQYHNFLAQMASTYKKVFVLSGNHEYYHHSIEETDIQIQNVCNIFPNVSYLNCTTDYIDGLKVVGCTLWSMPEDYLYKYINDYRCIKYNGNTLTPQDVREMHKKQVSWLTQEITSTQEPLVVLSHHAPNHQMNGKYKNGPYNSAFSTDLSHLFKNPVIGWICGHTHQNMTLTVNDIPCMTNCMGYKGESIGFRPDATFDVTSAV